MALKPNHTGRDTIFTLPPSARTCSKQGTIVTYPLTTLTGKTPRSEATKERLLNNRTQQYTIIIQVTYENQSSRIHRGPPQPHCLHLNRSPSDARTESTCGHLFRRKRPRPQTHLDQSRCRPLQRQRILVWYVQVGLHETNISLQLYGGSNGLIRVR